MYRLATDTELASERDALDGEAQRLASEVRRLADQLEAAKRSDAQHSQELAAARTEAAAERNSFEARASVQQQRVDECLARAEGAERSAAELRRDLEAATLARAELQRSASEARDALQSAWRDLGNATAERDLMGARVAMHTKEAEKLDDAARSSAETARQREEELREVYAALAAAREQRNQLAREAEACRQAATEATEELARQSELVSATDARVAAAERRVAMERQGRERAEGQLEEAAHARRETHAGHQKRMAAALVGMARAQCALGFERWRAACAALDAHAARQHASTKALLARERDSERQDAVGDLQRVARLLQRASVLGAAHARAMDLLLARRAATAALWRWSQATQADARCVRRWEALVRGAELAPTMARAARVGPSWRYVLQCRIDACGRLGRWGRAYAANALLQRFVFALWKLSWDRNRALECVAVAEARAAGLHVAGAPPWWEARA